jgi:hypothetical protein
MFQVGWVKADTKAIQAIHDHVITHNPRVSVSHLDVNTWNLHIKSVTEEDRGNFYVLFSFHRINDDKILYLGGYMCQINTDPMKSQVSKAISVILMSYSTRMFIYTETKFSLLSFPFIW